MSERAHVLIAPIDYIARVPHGSLSMVAHFPAIEILYAEKVEFEGENVVLTSHVYKFCTIFPARYLTMLTAK
jgi:hypothetical protein